MLGLLEKLSKVVSAGGLISGDALSERLFPGSNLPIALVRPRSTEEVAQIVAICHEMDQSRTMTVQAGVRLQTVQEKADEAGMLFPLDLGARGTATIGGNASTNAGGNTVVRPEGHP